MLRLVLAGAAAGALGWGIRGQYGHESGAMIAGLLVSLVIVAGLRPQAPAAWSLRAVAFGTIGVGFGGAMTYGQTIGLTQDAALVGNWAALRWGLLGLSIKGALWIGWFGACLGMGLGAVRYRAREVLLLMAALVGVAVLGTWLINAPYDPAQRILPPLYFSASWYWRPDAADLQPRREVWGGLLVSLAALAIYARAMRGDTLAPRLLCWGLIGGAIGFPLGQCLQAYHAWNPQVFSRGFWPLLDPHVNWWSAMETTFGAVMGAVVTAGAFRSRHLIASSPSFSSAPDTEADSQGPLTAGLEWIGLAVHVALLLIAEFADVPVLSRYADVSLLMGVLPLALATEGRWAPAMIALPVTMAPIAGKTLRRLAYEQQITAPWLGWLFYVAVPIAVTCAIAWWAVRRADRGDGLGPRVALVCVTWLYVGLNFAFFQYPWPWAPWTARTLHALVFLGCAVLLTAQVTTVSGSPRATSPRR
jgi:hypothetical protein